MNRWLTGVRVSVLALGVAIVVCGGFAGSALAGFGCSHQISLSQAAYSVQEGQPVTITVTDRQTASFANCGNATVHYATSNGTAQAPGDYTATSGTLTFTGTATGTNTATVTQTFQVPTVDNARQEGDLTFTVSLSAPLSADFVATTAPSTATVTIHDVDVAPVATTGAPSAASSSAATVTGTVNPNGQPTTYHFDYGTTTSYGQSTPDQAAGAGNADVAVSAALSGLTPATTYHFRLVATSAIGTSTGGDMTFTTTAESVAPSPPTATISSPAGGARFVQGRAVRTQFSCAEGAAGPGLDSCTDSRGAAGKPSAAGLQGSGLLDTSRVGRHTYTVTARSLDGLSQVTEISYTVVRAPLLPAHLRVHSLAAAAQDPRHCVAELNAATGASVPSGSCDAGIVTLSGTVDRRADGEALTIVVRARFAGRSYSVRTRTRVRGGRFSFQVTLPGRQTDLGVTPGRGGDRWAYTISLPSGHGLKADRVSGHFTLESETR